MNGEEMKKLIVYMFVGLILVGLVGCSGNDYTENTVEIGKDNEEMNNQIAETDGNAEISTLQGSNDENRFSSQVIEAAKECYNLTLDYTNGVLAFSDAKAKVENIIEEYKNTNLSDIPEFNRIVIFFNANTDEPGNEYLYNGLIELQKFLYPNEKSLPNYTILEGAELYDDRNIAIAYKGMVEYETVYAADNLDVPKSAIVFSVVNKTGQNLTIGFFDLHVNGVDSGHITSHSISANQENLVEVRFDELPEVVEDIHASGNIMFDDYSTSDFKF